MEYDIKQKVLIAIYTEYQKDIPNMGKNINANSLGMEQEIFKIALTKLENERLINGLKVAGTLENSRAVVWTDKIQMTPEGLEYVESKLGIDKTLSGIEKVKYISTQTINWGWDQLKDIAARTLAEMSKQ